MVAIVYQSGNLLSSKSRHILQSVNAKGAMNSGVARAIRERYPNVWKDYKEEEETRGLQLGNLIWSINDPHVVINVVGQEFYGREPNHRYVSYDAISKAFEQLNYEADHTQNDPTHAELRGGVINEVAMPLVGAGLAQGSWEIISAIIEYEAKTFQPIVWVL